MNGITILTVTKDADWLIGMRPALHAAGRGRLVVAQSVEEADRLLEFAKPRLIVVDWGNACCPTEELATLLWRNSIQPRPASVMIVADEYRVDEATRLYQLGVDEYVSDADHREKLGTILATHAPRIAPVDVVPSYANGSTAGHPGAFDAVGLLH